MDLPMMTAPRIQRVSPDHPIVFNRSFMKWATAAATTTDNAPKGVTMSAAVNAYAPKLSCLEDNQQKLIREQGYWTYNLSYDHESYAQYPYPVLEVGMAFSRLGS